VGSAGNILTNASGRGGEIFGRKKRGRLGSRGKLPQYEPVMTGGEGKRPLSNPTDTEYRHKKCQQERQGVGKGGQQKEPSWGVVSKGKKSGREKKEKS